MPSVRFGAPWRAVAAVAGLMALWVAPGPSEALGQEPATIAPFLDGLRARPLGPVEGPDAPSVLDVAGDMGIPFRVHAALGNAGAWAVPSSTAQEGGIGPQHWVRGAPGHAVSVLVDPRRPGAGLAVLSSGSLLGYDVIEERWMDVSPWAPPGTTLRYASRPPLARDPFRPELAYIGSQLVHRTGNEGRSWQVVSPVLSDGGAITSLSPSPAQEEVIWVGTSDGRIHLTRSSGGTWSELTERLPARARAVAGEIRVVPSRHHGAAAFAFIVPDEDEAGATLLLATENYGSSWERLEGQGIRGRLYALEQDPVRPELLFAGTSQGLFVSLDGADRWLPLGAGLPGGGVAAVAVHDRDSDLMIGTEAGGAWILDDVGPLRALAGDPSLVTGGYHLFQPPPAHLREGDVVRGFPPPVSGEGMEDAAGSVALLTYAVAEGETTEELDLEIVDSRGTVVRRASVPGSPGLHRVRWDLSMIPGGAEGDVGLRHEGVLPALPVLPGAFTVRLGGEDGGLVEEPVEVLPDPADEIPPEERSRKHDALRRGLLAVRLPLAARERLQVAVEALEELRGRLEAAGVSGQTDLQERVDTLLERGRTLSARVGAQRGLDEAPWLELLHSLASSFRAPTETQRIGLGELEGSLSELAEDVNDYLLGALTLLNDRLRSEGLDPLPSFDGVPTPGSEA